MRMSLPGSCGLPGSVYSSRTPLPFVSSTSAVQPCAFSISPVSSSSLVLIQPTFPPPPPVDIHSVSFASYPNCRWWDPKQVWYAVYFPVFGSYIVTRRFVLLSGNSTADGCVEPFLQKSGLAGLWPVAASHTRPLRSIIELWLFAFESQMSSSPQYADGPRMCTEPALPGPSASGISAVTGSVKLVATFLIGSRIGISLQACSHWP